MIKIHSLKIFNLEDALYGMRLPLMSHNKADSEKNYIGNNDLELCRKLIKAGAVHRKFLRQLPVSMIIEAPMYFFTEFDTYKVSTTRNSSSKMHKIMSKLLTIEDFSLEDIETDGEKLLVKQTLDVINRLILFYRNCDADQKEKTFRKVIQLLPESFNYTSVWTGTLENLYNMYYGDRKNHKLSEWREFCRIIIKNDLINILFDDKEKTNATDI